ncbi:MAG: 30S ribosomal protein S17 [Patescibacteria group bacterium]
MKTETKKLLNKKDSIKKPQKTRLQGIVISDKMQETVVVAVERFILNVKYKKSLKRIKKYKAHNKDNKYKTGDRVVIEECRPMSKEKRWIIVNEKK